MNFNNLNKFYIISLILILIFASCDSNTVYDKYLSVRTECNKNNILEFEVEFELESLLENNIETYRSVCFGQRVNWGIESESFFITEEIDGVCLTDWLAENYEKTDTRQKEAVMVSMADFIRRLHRAGVSMPDLYVWHLYMLNPIDPDDIKWAVIDLHRMSHSVKDSDKKIRNLGSLDYSMLDKYFTQELKKVFIKAYVKNDGLFADDKVTKKMQKRSAQICKKRNKKEY